MTQSSGSPISSEDNKEQAPTVEWLVNETVGRWVGQHATKPHHLKRLLHSPDITSASDALVEELRQKLGPLAPDDLPTAVALELKHQIREVIEPKEARSRRIETLSQFLETDLAGCIQIALEKAADAGVRESQHLEKFATDASLEVNQILLQAKKEFAASEISSSTDPAIREAVMHKIQELDHQYSIVLIKEQLEHELGMAFVAQQRRKVQQAEQALVAHQSRQNLSGPALEAAIAAHVKQIEELIDRAVKQALQQFTHLKIQEHVLQDLARLRTHFTDGTAIGTRLGRS